MIRRARSWRPPDSRTSERIETNWSPVAAVICVSRKYPEPSDISLTPTDVTSSFQLQANFAFCYCPRLPNVVDAVTG